MLTYDELAPILYKHAYRFAVLSHGRHTAHELISAVWLKGKCQKLPDIKLAHQRIVFDMIDYMRHERRKIKLNFVSLDVKLSNPNYIQEHPLELKEYIRHITRFLSPENKRICRMLAAGYTQGEICEILKIPRGSFGCRMKMIRRLFREHFQQGAS